MSFKVAKAVDIRLQVCPMTWVRVKLALESISPGEVLEVLLRGHEPLRNIPRSAREEGHELLETRHDGADSVIWLRKGS